MSFVASLLQDGEVNINSLALCIVYMCTLFKRREESTGPGSVGVSGQKDCDLAECFRSLSTARLLSEDNKWYVHFQCVKTNVQSQHSCV